MSVQHGVRSYADRDGNAGGAQHASVRGASPGVHGEGAAVRAAAAGSGAAAARHPAAAAKDTRGRVAAPLLAEHAGGLSMPQLERPLGESELLAQVEVPTAMPTERAPGLSSEPDGRRGTGVQPAPAHAPGGRRVNVG
jgi:hypothetical protein